MIKALKQVDKFLGSCDAKPIFPNCQFSPYNSPNHSPRSNRKRQPLRESRRVSIEKSGTYLQLNQYKLMDSIGQVNIYENFNVNNKSSFTIFHENIRSISKNFDLTNLFLNF